MDNDKTNIEETILKLRKDVIVLRYEVADLSGRVGKMEMRLEKLKQW